MQESQVKAQKMAHSQRDLTQRQAEILIELAEHLHQEYSIIQISEKFAISRETARMELHVLEKFNFISMVRKNRTFFYYVSDENLSRIKK